MIKNVIFDIGAVLVDWNPRYYYRTIINDEERIEKFLSEICTFEFNHTLDLGRPWDEARAELMLKAPDYADMIDDYWHKWLHMFAGPIHETVDILMDIKRRGYPVYALSNWNDVKFPIALQEFPFLRLFDGRIVSGEVKFAKPDLRIYQLLLDTYKLNPRQCLFIDDRLENVEAARKLGIEAVQFFNPRQLEQDLIQYGVIPSDAPDNETEGCGPGCSCHQTR